MGVMRSFRLVFLGLRLVLQPFSAISTLASQEPCRRALQQKRQHQNTTSPDPVTAFVLHSEKLIQTVSNCFLALSNAFARLLSR